MGLNVVAINAFEDHSKMGQKQMNLRIEHYALHE